MSLRPSSRTEVRKKSYKSGVDGDEARRRREDNLVEIRKSKREDSLLKKRREGLLLLQSQQSNERGTPSASASVIQQKVFTFFLELFFLHSANQLYSKYVLCSFHSVRFCFFVQNGFYLFFNINSGFYFFTFWVIGN